MDLHTWITQQADTLERIALKARDDITALLASGDVDNRYAERHIAANDPAAALRRCEADRRILARHREWAQSSYCEAYDQDLTTNLNDCPELLDLGHAHGLTDEILAGLDRPQPPERKPDAGPRLTHWLTPPITTSDVPEALRGPHWKP
ncbi:DUF6221 family protein [Streptomyces ziwulingensis]|uniref:Uncharacterized protein n=1 Tax=Streptomyces ziwulingensis TaxID=1045501 RepID=A0ABP9D6R0_9ACTN